MMKFLNWLRSEPAVIAGIIQAGIAVAAAFGFKLSPDQVAAVTGAAALILAQTVRASVTPSVKLPPPPSATPPPT